MNATNHSSLGDGADGTPLTGRAGAVLDQGKLAGMFFIHQGDESGFTAKKAAKQ